MVPSRKAQAHRSRRWHRRLVLAFAITLLSTAVPSGVSPALPTVADPFYEVPAPLAVGAPGDLIKDEALVTTPSGVQIERVMYHSRSIAGDDIAVTGLTYTPPGGPPSGGWPVVAWAHGTAGIADECAPSSLGPSSLLEGFALAGYVVTATDYEGLGTPGRHPYLVGESAARSVLDSVRAARNTGGTEVSDRFLVFGHSQGGHAGLFAGEYASSWAPELDLVGIVAAAPASNLAAIYQSIAAGLVPDTPLLRAYIVMIAAGFEAGHGADLDLVMTTDGLAAVDSVDLGCTGTVTDAVSPYVLGDLVDVDPTAIEPWASLLDLNSPGDSPVPAPILVVHGTSDEQVPVQASEILAQTYDATGQPYTLMTYAGVDHSGVIGAAINDISSFVADQFGTPTPVETISTTTTTTTTTPVAVAAATRTPNAQPAQAATPIAASPTFTG